MSLAQSTTALPYLRRSRVALGLTRAAAEGRFELQQCLDCGQSQYPPQEICIGCLSDRLEWREHAREGILINEATVHHSIEPALQKRAPLRTGMIALAGGVKVLSYLHRDCLIGEAVDLSLLLDCSGSAVPVATPKGVHFREDPALKTFSNAPTGRGVLITDATTDIGRACAAALAKAGPSRMWLGHPAEAAAQHMQHASALALSADDPEGLAKTAAQIGEHLDLVINTVQVRSQPDIGPEAARTQMQANFFSLMALADAFAPAIAARQGVWVNLLAIEAIAANPDAPGFSASMAAANSLIHSLRARLTTEGARFVAIYPGPIAGPMTENLPGPKLSPEKLVAELLASLRDGVEDVFPDPVSRDIRDRNRSNPKALEREIMNCGSRAFAGGSDL